MQKILKDDIVTLNLEKQLKSRLKESNVNTVLELCNLSRMELSSLDFTNSQINDIAICLQLSGLDLKKNHAKKNSTISGIR